MRLQTLDFAGRRKIIELLVDRVILSHHDIELRYAVPLRGWNRGEKKETLRLPYRTQLRLDDALSTVRVRL